MKTKALLIALFAALFECCAPSTSITGSWKNPKTSTTYENIMVAALTGNTVVRSTLETGMADALEKSAHVSKSIDEFPPGINNKDSSKATLMRKMKNKNADAVLTISILSRETESRYVRNTGPYAPAGYVYYNDFGIYYDHWYPSFYDEGYYVQDKVYFIETNLYDTHTQKLIWSAQSKTYSYDNLEPFAKGFASVIVAKLKEDGVLKSASKK